MENIDSLYDCIKSRKAAIAFRLSINKRPPNAPLVYRQGMGSIPFSRASLMLTQA